MISLRARLLAGTTAISVAVLSVLGVVLDQSLRHTLRRHFDDRLRSDANALLVMVKGKKDEVKIDSAAQAMAEFLPGEHEAYFEVTAGGKVIGRSASLGGGQSVGGPEGVDGAAPRVDAVVLPDGRPGRVLTVSFFPQRDPGGSEKDDGKRSNVRATLKVARDARDLDATLGQIRLVTVSLFGAGTVISGAFLWLLVERATRPMRRLADQIGGLSPEGLTAVDTGGLPAELSPVAERLNVLLGQVGETFDRERAFTADVAHELRTPLAGVLTTLEVCRGRPREGPEYEAAIDASLAMLLQMQALVQNLLLLARAEGGQLTIRAAPAALAELVTECWGGNDSRAHAAAVDVHISIAPTVEIECDRTLARIVINNLLDNAASYVDAGGRVEITAEAGETAATLRVANTGCTLTAEELTHVFDRLWRKDVARSQTGMHAGLGLGLAKRLMMLQGGELTVEAAGGIFRASATFRRHVKSVAIESAAVSSSVRLSTAAP